MKRTGMLLAAAAMAAVLGLSACEKKGPVEQAAEEVDEGIDTLKNGKESTASKLDDAGDKAADAVEKAKDAVTGE
ncbi:MAG: hypothetical protein ABI859_06115 [Pseudomonadota bacterium]